MSANEDEFNFRTDANDYADANDMEGEAGPEPEEAHAAGAAPDPLPWEEPGRQAHARQAPPDVVYAPREQPQEPAPAPQEHTIAPSIMIGPSSSGKTTLLLAIGRACHLAEGADLELEFVPDENTAQLMRLAIKRITERQQGPEATRGKPDHYPFWIHVLDKPASFWEPPLDTDLYMVMSDGGGGYLFPTDENSTQDQWRNELIASARSAVSIIFCVDATEPQTSLMEKELPLLLSKITEPRVVDVALTPRQRAQNWFHQHMNRFRRRPTPPLKTRRSKPCLNVERFLLLLTQVDKLCYKMDDPAKYASLIDPVEQARDLLGIPLLNSIRSALKPGAVFAAGISSAWGFRSDGEPFADPDGMPVGLAGESGEDILRRWTPFGIRDALYFIATGRCRGKVKEITGRDLELMRGVEPIPFSFSQSDEHVEVES